MGDDMQLGINNTQTQLEINNSAKKQENELNQIYGCFLKMVVMRKVLNY